MSFEVILEVLNDDEEWEMSKMLVYSNPMLAEWFGLSGEDGMYQLEEIPFDVSEQGQDLIRFRGQEEVIVIENPNELNHLEDEEWSDREIQIMDEIAEFTQDMPNSRLLVYNAPELREVLMAQDFNPIQSYLMVDNDDDEES